jgi:hypothetical protein
LYLLKSMDRKATTAAAMITSIIPATAMSIVFSRTLQPSVIRPQEPTLFPS